MIEVGTVQYSKETHEDVNMLSNYGLLKPADLNKGVTYLYGADDYDYSLDFILNQGTSKPVNTGDGQYKWKIMGKRRVTSQVVRLVSQVDKPGLGYSEFEVEFRDNFLIYQHGAISPDGASQVRIQSEGKKTAQGTYVYLFQLQTGNADAFVNLENFEPGKHWGDSVPTVPLSKSDGNRTNSQTWSEATNQLSLYRFSDQIAGNIANIVVQYDITTDDGLGNISTDRTWMPYQWKLFQQDIRRKVSEDAWLSEYNRDAAGRIHLKDPENGEVIPRGNGILATLKAINNYETFSKLTVKRIDSILSRIFYNRNDNTPAEIVLYAGKGFIRMFQDAIETEAIAKGYLVALGGEKIRNGGEYLKYGKYFRQYETPDGQTITVKPASIFNKGTIAQMDIQNGRMLNGLPYSSYTGVFLDHSATNMGGRNIELVHEEGREYIEKVYEGMSPLPKVWSGTSNRAATRKDIATLEVMMSRGINITNPTTSFVLSLAA